MISAYENLQDWCEHYVHFFFVQTELEDVGIVNEEIDKEVELAIKMIRKAINSIEKEKKKS